jgi:hypothetical protein
VHGAGDGAPHGNVIGCPWLWFQICVTRFFVIATGFLGDVVNLQ